VGGGDFEAWEWGVGGGGVGDGAGAGQWWGAPKPFTK